MLSRVFLLLLPATITAQNLGVYLSPCSSDAPIPEVESGIINGYQLGSDAVCLPSDTTPNQGFEICPAPAVFDAYFTDTNFYFRCAKTLSATCNGGCSPGTFCISTTLPLSTLPFYFCGLPCAGGFYLCDDTATKYLNPSFTAFCDPVADQCGTCSSSDSLLENGGCTPSATISALPVRASGSRKRDSTEAAAMENHQRHDVQSVKGYSTGLLKEIQDMDCPPRSRKCPASDQDLEDDWECVAVKEDIESCGGCPGKGGIDCTRLPGVKFGAATCLDGVCVAHQCTDDGSYVLVNATCVPSSALLDFTEESSNDPSSLSPGVSSLHPDLSTEILVPEALRVLSAIRTRQDHYHQYDPRSYHLGSVNSHPRDRSTLMNRNGGEAYHVTRLKQARIDPEVEITIHMQYSNPIMTLRSSDERISGPMDASTGTNEDVATVNDATESWKARLNSMKNVRVVPSKRFEP